MHALSLMLYSSFSILAYIFHYTHTANTTDRHFDLLTTHVTRCHNLTGFVYLGLFAVEPGVSCSNHQGKNGHTDLWSLERATDIGFFLSLYRYRYRYLL